MSDRFLWNLSHYKVTLHAILGLHFRLFVRLPAWNRFGALKEGGLTGMEDSDDDFRAAIGEVNRSC